MKHMEGQSASPQQMEEVMAGPQVVMTRQPWHQLTDPTKCPFKDQPVEIVQLVAQHCDSAMDMAAFSGTSKWLHVIVSPIVYDRTIVECRWWVIFWAAEHGYTSMFQRIKAAEQRYRAAANADDFTAAGLPIDWNRELPGIILEVSLRDVITWPRKDIDGQKPRRGPRWLVTGRRCAPLHLAVLNGHLDTVKFLLDNGANIEAVSGFVCMPYHNYQLGPNEIRVEVTPLILAFLQGDCDAVKLLLKREASLNVLGPRKRNRFGTGHVYGMTTPLHLLDQVLQTSSSSSSNGDPASSEEKKQKLFRLIQVLVQSGRISVNTTDYLGVTPLSHAVAMSNAPAIEALLASGADPDL
ncbi:palmitoyltransferase AKR1 [Apiospora arundinis]|uniref:Palmitoyltransferase AKR1 n=1 Tax=Apiospora arundinis TaxID=335852 RepID=A0ABR2I369_9PEZI